MLAVRYRHDGDDRRLRRIVWGIIALLHVAMLIGLYFLARAQGLINDRPRESVLEIVFLPEPTPPSEAPTPEAAPEITTPITSPATASTPPARRAKPGEQTMSVEFGPPAPTTKPTAEVRLFGSDGRPLVSQSVIDAADAKPMPGYVDKPREGDRFVGDHDTVKYRSTRFNRYWRRDKETLGQEIVRKVPLAAIILQGVEGDPCPPRSEDPECESQARPQKLESPFPQDWYEEFSRH